MENHWPSDDADCGADTDSNADADPDTDSNADGHVTAVWISARERSDRNRGSGQEHAQRGERYAQRFGFLPGNAQTAIVEAARSTPNAGSVTQSSNADAGVTTDSVSVEVTRGTDGTVTFEVSEAGGWTVDGSSARVLNSGTNQQEGWSWAEFHQAPDGTSGTGTGPGLYVDVYTDIAVPTEAPARCGVGSTVSAGSPCIWEANGQRFTLSIESSGAVCFRGGALDSCSGGNQRLRSTTINGITLTVVTEGSGASRRIAALSDNLMLVGGSGGGPVQDADYLAGGIWVRVPARRHQRCRLRIRRLRGWQRSLRAEQSGGLDRRSDVYGRSDSRVFRRVDRAKLLP